MRKNLITICFGLCVCLALAGCGDWQQYFNVPGHGHYARGRELLRDGELDAALDELTRAARIDPKNADVRTALGDVYRKKGDFTKASRSYRAACKADPYSFRPHYNLGVTYQAMADLARSLKKARLFLRKAVQVYIRSVALRPGSFDANLNLGACYFQLGKTGLAQRQTLEALKINPHSAKANNNLAIMLDVQGKLEEAILAYKASIEAKPNQPGIMMNLGAIYLRLGRVKSALATYRSAARLSPDSAKPYEQMGVCLFRMKRLDGALDAFAAAIKKNSQSPGAYRGYGVICMYKYVLDRSKAELKNKALRAWEFSLKLKPGQDDLVRLIKRFGPASKPKTKAQPTKKSIKKTAAKPNPSKKTKPSPTPAPKTKPATKPATKPQPKAQPAPKKTTSPKKPAVRAKPKPVVPRKAKPVVPRKAKPSGTNESDNTWRPNPRPARIQPIDP